MIIYNSIYPPFHITFILLLLTIIITIGIIVSSPLLLFVLFLLDKRTRRTRINEVSWYYLVPKLYECYFVLSAISIFNIFGNRALRRTRRLWFVASEMLYFKILWNFLKNKEKFQECKKSILATISTLVDCITKKRKKGSFFDKGVSKGCWIFFHYYKVFFFKIVTKFTYADFSFWKHMGNED